MTIDLRACVTGQKLRMRNGVEALYVSLTGENRYPHKIKYVNDEGTRTDAGRYLDSVQPHALDITEILPMPTDSTIPPRGTKEFARYAAETMMAGAAGQTIQVSMRDQNDFTGGSAVSWNWDMFDYRIKPKPTRRWYTQEEFYALVPTHGRIIARKVGGVEMSICHPTDAGGDPRFYTEAYTVTDRNFNGYEKSLDGGKTWQPFGVEES